MVKRIVRFDGAKGYELAFAALANFQAGPHREDVALEAVTKLASIGKPKPREQGQNVDLELMTLDGPAEVELLEAERDLVLEAIAKVAWPTFALANKRRAVDILRNAEAREIAST